MMVITLIKLKIIQLIQSTQSSSGAALFYDLFFISKSSKLFCWFPDF